MAKVTRGELPTQPEEHRDNPEKQGEITKDRYQTGSKELVERIDVVGDARHQAADRIAIKVGYRQALQTRKDLRAQGRRERTAPSAASGSPAGRAPPKVRISDAMKTAATSRMPVSSSMPRLSSQAAVQTLGAERTASAPASCSTKRSSATAVASGRPVAAATRR